MPRPFIVWTMQRSGGTSFASMLESLVEGAQVLHEPFNGNQCFGSIAKGAPRESDKSEYYARELAALQSEHANVSFKHCYEVHSTAFNRSLADFARETDRAAVLLRRSNSFERQLSLIFAKATGAWSKDQLSAMREDGVQDFALPPIDIDAMIAHEEVCRRREREISEYLGLGDETVVVDYEELYSGDFESRCRRLDPVLQTLHAPATASNERTANIEQTFMYQKQGGKSVYSSFPNYAEAEEVFGRYFDDEGGAVKAA